MIPEMNNSLHGLNKLETAENRISELVNKLSENTQSNVQKRKKEGKDETEHEKYIWGSQMA